VLKVCVFAYGIELSSCIALPQDSDRSCSQNVAS